MIHDELTDLVEQALRHWPAIAYLSKPGNRARSAAALVRAERVRFLGGEWWEVNDHRCTPTTCDCEDRAPVDERGAKLCKHCLAARMVIRLRDNQALQDRLAEIATVTGDDFTLLIDRDYDSRKRSLLGYRSRGRDVRWPAGQRPAVTFEQMTAALAALGWSLADLPRKGGGWEYRFAIRRDAGGVALTAAIWNLKGVSDLMVERHRNERLAQWSMEELGIRNTAGLIPNP